MWLPFAYKREALCSDCMFERADRNEVELAITDLRPCPFNYGWFIAFLELSLTDASPESIAA